MFVSQLDRPWQETSLGNEGFLIRSTQQCCELQRQCAFVLLDPERGQLPRHYHPDARPSRDKPLQLLDERCFHDGHSWQSELPPATLAFSEFLGETKQLLTEVDAHAALSLKPVRYAVELLTRTLLRRSDACLWLARLKRNGRYHYQHAIGCGVWALALGRRLGFDDTRLEQIGLGALLMDLGKSILPASLLEKPEPLSAQEQKQMRSHVTAGSRLLRELGISDPDVLAMAQHHHERHDGNGYPLRRYGEQIPLAGRIAALVDAYDAMTRERPFALKMSPSEAIRFIHAERDHQFQQELVEEFIHAVGLYPDGSLVELSTGEVGVVLSGYRLSRLRPRILLLLDASKQLLPAFTQLNLDQQLEDAKGHPLFIRRALPAGAYDLDPDRFFL